MKLMGFLKNLVSSLEKIGYRVFGILCFYGVPQLRQLIGVHKISDKDVQFAILVKLTNISQPRKPI